MIHMTASVPIYAMSAMSNRDYRTIRSHHGVGVEVRFDPPEVVAGELSLELLAGTVIKIENTATTVIVHLSPEVEQILDDERRDTPLLQASLGMVSNRQHGCPFLIEKR